MLIFIDCEFTDFLDIDLISIGMVSADRKYEFYAERTDFRVETASDFVKGAVIPQLGKAVGVACTREELKVRLWAFFGSIPGEIRLATDSHRDVDLLYNALGNGLPSNLSKSFLDLREQLVDPVFNAAVNKYHSQTGHSWHHALHDARANCYGWLEWRKSTQRPTD